MKNDSLSDPLDVRYATSRRSKKYATTKENNNIGDIPRCKLVIEN
jgi:hypothetical protein